ncbi:MAG TPA: class I SAM-dependent methyltransferase [Planctomycetes bacterium]|nr:class I SAM-dependent methyltransferase [Planctomycetota bacterium]
MEVQFGKTSEDYGKHRRGFPPSFFAFLEKEGWEFSSMQVLDLGTGTGTLALELAQRGAQVTGIDLAEEQLRVARTRAKELGLSLGFQGARAEALPFSEACFDAVFAGQCWHWFDGPRAAEECHRVLKPGGRLVLAHFDWLPLSGRVAAMTEALILEHNPFWTLGGGNGLHPEHIPGLQKAGFHVLPARHWDEEVLYSHEDWRGRIRASAGVGASLPPERVEAFDREHRRLLADRFPEDPLRIPHRVFVLVCERGSSA